jgi:hypothetical protein
LAHHVSRIAPMGARVLINGTRYKLKSSSPGVIRQSLFFAKIRLPR